MNTKKVILYAVVVIALVALGVVVHQRVHFQWSVFAEQIRHVSGVHLLLAFIAIYLNYAVRGVRWACFLRPTKKVGLFSLVGSQVIGFTAVAIFGRLADLVRPYLITKRTGLALSSQIAIYTVERMFDLGSMALIFGLALLFAPDRATLPHHQALQHTAIGFVAVTVFLAVFAVAVHWSGLVVANIAEKNAGLPFTQAGRGCCDQDP